MDGRTAIEIYESVSKPPKQALREIIGGKLKGKTDINPQWRYRVMTENFGLVGVGWKFEIKKLWTETGAGGELLAFAEVSVSVKQGSTWSEQVTGVGGSKLVQIEKDRLVSNDEGYKMAITDAIGTALKMFGVAAAVYEGLWDGDKYIDDLTCPAKPKEPQAKNAQGQSLKGGQSTPEQRERMNSVLSKKYDNGQAIFSDKEKSHFFAMRKEKTANEVIEIAMQEMAKRIDAYHQNYGDSPEWHH